MDWWPVTRSASRWKAAGSRMIKELAHTFFALAMLACILIGAAFLTGCETSKYAECIARDRTSNPCN